MKREKPKLLLFDLDGTLLRRNKTASARNLAALEACRRVGAAVGVATSRSERNAQFVLKELRPEVLITNGGASVRVRGERVYADVFSPDETAETIAAIREVCGRGVYMDIDTDSRGWRNYSSDVFDDMGTWGETRQTDFEDFREEALMLCVEIPDPQKAAALQKRLRDCDMVKFTDGDWYKLTRAGITKEAGLFRVCEALGIRPENIAAFGDDFSDLEMLRRAGLGVAMANAVPEVRAAADLVIGDCDSDTIAELLENLFSLKEE